MLRKVLGIVVGLIVSMAVIALVETLGQHLFPPSAAIDMRNPAQVARFVDVLPLALKISVVTAWFVGTLAGGWAALAVSHWRAVPWIVAAGVIVGAILSFTQIPHPVWMQAAGIALPLLAAWIVLRLVARRPGTL